MSAPGSALDLFGTTVASDHVPDLVRQLTAGVVVAHDAHVSVDTRSTYDDGWADYVSFVEALRAEGVDLPMQPTHFGDTRHLGTLAMWLVWCCTQRQVVYLRKDGSHNVRQVGLAWRSVQTRLAGVIDELQTRGAPNPRHNETFRRVVRGLANTHAERPDRVSALTGPLLRQTLDATRAPAPLLLRDRALLAVFSSPTPAPVASRLRWEHLRTEADRWVFDDGTTELNLRARPGQDLCPVAALASWRLDGLGGAATGPVFPALAPDGQVKRSPDGTAVASSRQALAKRVRAIASLAQLATSDRFSLDATTASLLATAAARERPIDLRDRAVLAVGLAAASRRRNLSAFVVGDAVLVDRGLLLNFRRTKTTPRVADINRVGGHYCPVTLLEEWMDRYAELLGRPLRPSDPLFPRLSRHSTLVLEDGAPVALARPSFADIVEQRAAAAGLVGRFRSHSLRRGLATTLASNKVSLQEIARLGGWRSLEVVWAYIEEAGYFDSEVSDLLGLSSGSE